MKSYRYVAIVFVATITFSGCGSSNSADSVFVESEMAKYRSTPEDRAQAEKVRMEMMRGPSPQEIQEMKRKAKEAEKP